MNVLFRLILKNATELDSTLFKPRVLVKSEDVISIEFARAIDVHRLVRAKEKRARNQRADRTKRARAAPPAPKREVVVVDGVTQATRKIDT
jgi:ribosomal 50S subunit-recycling heat shock protein